MTREEGLYKMDQFVQSMKERSALDDLKAIYNMCSFDFQNVISFDQVEDAIWKGQFDHLIEMCDKAVVTIGAITPRALNGRPFNHDADKTEKNCLKRFLNIIHHIKRTLHPNT
jgi:hypothetical protein